MSDKPEGFVVTRVGEKFQVEQHVSLYKDDFISFRVTNSIKDKPDPAISDLNSMALTVVIRHLLTLLPADHPGPPFVPGPRKPQ